MQFFENSPETARVFRLFLQTNESARVADVRDRVYVPKTVRYREPLLQMHAKRLVQLATAVQNVGDLAHRHGARAHIAQALIDRQLFLAPDAKRLVQLAAVVQ